jgi:hypothetical protein
MRNWLKIIVTLTILGLFSNANAQGYCDGPNESEDSDGVITLQGTEGGIDCAFAPDEYTITIFKMALCTSAPTRPTAADTYDVSSCVDIINSPDGQAVNLAAGEEMVLSDVSRPADGSYSYGYILMGNNFGIKAKKQFTNTMHTYQDGTSGNYCWTKDATEYASENDNLEGGGWADPSPLVECGGAGGTAGVFNEILDQFGVDEYAVDPFPVNGGTLSADLIKEDGLLATTPQSADTLFGVQTFTTPVVVTPSSSVFTVSFGVNQASSMWFYEDIGRGNPNQYQVFAIGSGPFSTFMTVE